MTFLPERGYKRILIILLFSVVGLFLAQLFFKFLFFPLLPFILAWGIAMLLSPFINYICRHTALKRKTISFICVTLTFVLIFGILSLICRRAVEELRQISAKLMSDASGTVEELFDYIYNLSERLPFLAEIKNRELAERIKLAAIDMAEGVASSLSKRLPTVIIGFFSSLPSTLLFLLALITATFYMSGDMGKINESISLLLPSEVRRKLLQMKKKVSSALGRYIRAYLILLVITFFQLLIGFSILGVNYSLTLAAIISLIDILPVLGAGTVIIPWAILLLLQKNIYLGVGLLLLFAVIWISRQIIEPKIVGQSIGLSPLATLISIYSGYKLMGITGLFFFPIGVIVAKSIFDASRDARK